VASLKEAMGSYLESHNEKPKAFNWTASADCILKKTADLGKGLAWISVLHRLILIDVE